MLSGNNILSVKNSMAAYQIWARSLKGKRCLMAIPGEENKKWCLGLCYESQIMGIDQAIDQEQTSSINSFTTPESKRKNWVEFQMTEIVGEMWSKVFVSGWFLNKILEITWPVLLIDLNLNFFDKLFPFGLFLSIVWLSG